MNQVLDSISKQSKSTPEFIWLSGVDFHRFAGVDFDLWLSLVNMKVQHPFFGDGFVVEVKKMSNHAIRVNMGFGNRPVVLDTDGFTKGSIRLALAIDYAREIQSRLTAEKAAVQSPRSEIVGYQSRIISHHVECLSSAEKCADESDQHNLIRNELMQLSAKYRVSFSDCWDGKKPGLLAMILYKLESREQLGSLELSQLRHSKFAFLLAHYYYMQFRDSGDYWYMVRCCSQLRKARMPSKAIEAAESSLKGSPKLEPRVQSAMLTTMGGAWRDIRQLQSAETKADEAVSLGVGDYHPHNLLGAIFYQKGEPSRGDMAFQKARRLGAPARTCLREIESSLFFSCPENRVLVRDYLLKKDYSKYAYLFTDRRGSYRDSGNKVAA